MNSALYYLASAFAGDLYVNTRALFGITKHSICTLPGNIQVVIVKVTNDHIIIIDREEVIADRILNHLHLRTLLQVGLDKLC